MIPKFIIVNKWLNGSMGKQNHRNTECHYTVIPLRLCAFMPLGRLIQIYINSDQFYNF
jgi:hypothetical protein